MEECIIHYSIKVPSEFIFSFDNLNNLLKQVNSISGSNNDISFDFSDTYWMNAEMTTIFGALFENFFKNNNSILIKQDFYPKVKEIIQKNGFLSFYQLERKIQDVFGSTIPYYVFKSNEIDSIDRYLGEEVFKKITEHVSHEEIEILENALYEVIHNIKDHAESDLVIMCGQYYHSQRQLVFTIADVGITIPNKVNQIKNMNDLDCIDWAIQKGNSTKNIISSGLGLFDIKSNLSGIGMLQIVSNHAYWEQNIYNTVTRKVLVSAFPGTLINMTLYLDGNYLKRAYYSNKDNNQDIGEIELLF